MATVTVRVSLETRKLDREYAQPFIREARYGDIIEFFAVDDTFTITIPNQDDFLVNEDGSDAGDNLSVTLNTGGTKKWKVADGPLPALYKYYDVCWDAQKSYADRPGASPPKIIIHP